MMELRKVSLTGDLRQNIEMVSRDAAGTRRFLCRQGWRLFVDSIGDAPTPDDTLPANTPDGHCLYVGPPGKNPCVPIDRLDEMYYIVGGDF